MPNKEYLLERKEQAKILEYQKDKATNKWKWKVPWLAFTLAFIHPIGMLYSSLGAAVVYFLVWCSIGAYRHGDYFWVKLAVSVFFSIYAYVNTKKKNAAIEKWRYGLKGSGNQNPKALGLPLKGPDNKRRVYPFF